MTIKKAKQTLNDFKTHSCGHDDCCMEELKTLKDIDAIKGNIFENDFRAYQEIKQEAIKWIKELNRVNKKHTLELSKYNASGSDSSTNSNVVRFIIDFFNITDEDLKK